MKIYETITQILNDQFDTESTQWDLSFEYFKFKYLNLEQIKLRGAHLGDQK